MASNPASVPRATCFLFLAVELAISADAKQSCSMAPLPMAAHGSSLLQHTSKHLDSIKVTSDAKANAAEQPKVFREDYMEKLQAFQAEQHLRESRAGRRVSPSVASAASGMQLLGSACSDTPGWQNWAGWTCKYYVEQGLCAQGGGAPGFEWAFGEWLGNPEDNCCACGKGTQATCSVYSCPYGWSSKTDQASSTEVSKENCCEMTCAAYVVEPSCPDGYEPDWDKSGSRKPSEKECCKGTTTTTTPAPFEGPGKAKYVRFLPQAWSVNIAMRAAVLVGNDLEMVDPPEESRIYSSVKPLNNQYVQEGSDGHPGSSYGRSMAEQCCGHAWSPKVNKVGEWMQINLPRNMDVRGVVVIGKPKRGCPYKKPNFVKSLKIETATAQDPTTFEARDGGKVFNTIKSANKKTVRILFGRKAPTSPPPTCGGTAGGAPCKYPFTYKGVEYHACTNVDRHEPWCYAADGTWGNCNCPTLAPTTEPRPVPTPAPAPTTKAIVKEICPDQLYTGRVLCDDGTAVQQGQCCPDNGFCPSDCVESASKSTDADGKETCSCKGCSKERKLTMSNADAHVKAHNYLRCLHGHPALQWDDVVAKNAQHPADQSCNAGDLIHSDSYDAKPPAGENLAIGLATPERAAAAWYNELLDPGYVAGTWGSDAIAAGVGHYTAMIWKATKKLGCASCASAGPGAARTVWACQYAEEAPNSGAQLAWEENVPQSDDLEETPETCCKQIYS